jgi:GAF domain-containing protein
LEVHPFHIADANLGLQQCNALLSVADVVCLRHRPDEFFAELIPHLQSVVPFDLLAFAVLRNPEKVKLEYWEGSRRAGAPVEIALNDSIAGMVWRSQAALSLGDAASETRFWEESRSLREREIRSYCAVPLTNFHQKLGALGFGRKQTLPFTS